MCSKLRSRLLNGLPGRFHEKLNYQTPEEIESQYWQQHKASVIMEKGKRLGRKPRLLHTTMARLNNGDNITTDVLARIC